MMIKTIYMARGWWSSFNRFFCSSKNKTEWQVYTHNKKNSTTSDDDERDFEILWIFLVIFFWIKKKFDLVFQPNTQTSVKINMKQTTKKNQLMEFEFTRMSRILWSEFFIFSTYERKRMASQKIFHFQMAKNSINWE